MASSKDTRTATRPTRSTWIEWTIGLLSLMLVTSLIGWIAIDLLTSKETPPDLTVKPTHVTKLQSGWLVEFEVENLATETAAEVGITATLSANREKVEENSATLDYVPGRSKARGGLFFSRNPAEHQLEITADGYRQP